MSFTIDGEPVTTSRSTKDPVPEPDPRTRYCDVLSAFLFGSLCILVGMLGYWRTLGSGHFGHAVPSDGWVAQFRDSLTRLSDTSAAFESKLDRMMRLAHKAPVPKHLRDSFQPNSTGAPTGLPTQTRGKGSPIGAPGSSHVFARTPDCLPKCLEAGHCCKGLRSGCQHPSCAMGCEIAGVSPDLQGCKDSCREADGKCLVTVAGLQLNMCSTCDGTCGSTTHGDKCGGAASGFDGCLLGCEMAFSSASNGRDDDGKQEVQTQDVPVPETAPIQSAGEDSDSSQLPLCGIKYKKGYPHTKYGDGVWRYTGDGEAVCKVEGANDRVTADFAVSPPKRTGPHTRCEPGAAAGTARLMSGYRAECHPERECSMVNASEERRVIESLLWVWKPAGCKLHEWDNGQLESILSGDRWLFMVGDSITTGQWDSLQCTLPPKVAHRIVHSRDDELGISLDIREGLLNGSLVPDKLLSSVTRHWKRLFASISPRNNAPVKTESDILVFNTGAHWTMAPAQAAKVFSVVAKALQRTFRGTIVFRTNVMGHDRCEEFSEPSADALNRASKYNWANFTLYNQAVVGAFEGVYPRFEVMDLSMYELRGDGHVTYGDCLHYCTPGPPDHWNKLLYHILLTSLSNT